MYKKVDLDAIKNRGLRKAAQQEGSVYRVAKKTGIWPQNVYIVMKRGKLPPLLAIRLFQIYNIPWKDLGY